MFLMFSTFTLVGYPQVNPEALVTCILCMWSLLLFYRLVYETIYLSWWLSIRLWLIQSCFLFAPAVYLPWGSCDSFFLYNIFTPEFKLKEQPIGGPLLVFIGKGKRKHDGSFTRSDTLLPLPCHQTKQVT